MHIAVIAGEASGDVLGGSLITALRQRFPNAGFSGMAGPKMIAAGCEPIHHIDELSVMGFTDVLKVLPRLLKLRRNLVDHYLDVRPDVVVGIDVPDFNLGLERRLREQGIPTVHYVSPTVWAWRKGRIKGIKRAVDLMLTLFPFEARFYREHAVPVEFVGHPLADEIDPDADQTVMRRTLADAVGFDPKQPILGVLPGSRGGEVRLIAEPFLGAAHGCSEQVFAHDGRHLQVVIPAFNEKVRGMLEPQIEALRNKGVAVFLVDGRSHEVMAASDVLLLASGTATLEATLSHKPMVVGYRLSRLSSLIYRLYGLNSKNRFSLPNLLLDEDVVPEFIQRPMTAELLGDALLPLLISEEARQAQTSRFREVHTQLRRQASERAADAITSLVAQRSGA